MGGESGMTLAASPGKEHDDILPVRVTIYYDTFLPKTSEGLMISVRNLTDPTLNISG